MQRGVVIDYSVYSRLFHDQIIAYMIDKARPWSADVIVGEFSADELYAGMQQVETFYEKRARRLRRALL